MVLQGPLGVRNTSACLFSRQSADYAPCVDHSQRGESAETVRAFAYASRVECVMQLDQGFRRRGA